MLGRRKFIGTLSAGMAASMVPAGVVSAGQRTLRERLAGSVDRTFVLRDSDGKAMQARLVSLDEGPDCPGLEQFSIVFEGDGLGEGLYEVYHPNTGTLQVGLVASGKTGAARQRAYFSTFV